MISPIELSRFPLLFVPSTSFTALTHVSSSFSGALMAIVFPSSASTSDAQTSSPCFVSISFCFVVALLVSSKSCSVLPVLLLISGAVISIFSSAMYSRRLSIHCGACFRWGVCFRPSSLSGCAFVFMVLLFLYIAPLIIRPRVVSGFVMAWCTIFSFSSFTTSDHLSHPIPIPLAQKASFFVVFAIPLFAAFMFLTRPCSLSMLSIDAFDSVSAYFALAWTTTFANCSAALAPTSLRRRAVHPAIAFFSISSIIVSFVPMADCVFPRCLTSSSALIHLKLTPPFTLVSHFPVASLVSPSLS